MNIPAFIAAVSAYVVSCLGAQSPPVTLQGDNAQINYGLDFLARADTYPRIVATPSEGPEMYGPADKKWEDMSDLTQTQWTPPSFGVGTMVDFHCWAEDEQSCLGLVADICEALQQCAGGVAHPVLGFWPQVRSGKTLTAIDGREYVLRVSVQMPVTRALYPTVSGVVGAIGTEMDFADGTSQKDPA